MLYFIFLIDCLGVLYLFIFGLKVQLFFNSSCSLIYSVVFSGINLIDVEKHEIINKIKVVGGVLNIIKQGNFLFTNGVFKGNYDTIQKWEIVNKKNINENNKNKNGKQNNINFNIIKKEVKHKLNNNHFILMNVLNNGIIATTTFQFNIKLWK